VFTLRSPQPVPSAQSKLALLARVAPLVIATLLGAGLVFLPNGSTSDDAFSFGMTAAWLGPCLEAARFSRGEFALCFSLFSGEVHAAVKDSRQADSGSSVWFAGSASANATVRIVGPFTVELDLSGLTPLGPYRLSAKNCDVIIFQQTPVALLASLGVGVSFR
jgi:hypothetical protein